MENEQSQNKFLSKRDIYFIIALLLLVVLGYLFHYFLYKNNNAVTNTEVIQVADTCCKNCKSETDQLLEAQNKILEIQNKQKLVIKNNQEIASNQEFLRPESRCNSVKQEKVKSDYPNNKGNHKNKNEPKTPKQHKNKTKECCVVEKEEVFEETAKPTEKKETIVDTTKSKMCCVVEKKVCCEVVFRDTVISGVRYIPYRTDPCGLRPKDSNGNIRPGFLWNPEAGYFFGWLIKKK